MTNSNPPGTTRVIIGVDTHRDEHAAAATDRLDARLGQYRLPDASSGYEDLHIAVSRVPKWSGKSTSTRMGMTRVCRAPAFSTGHLHLGSYVTFRAQIAQCSRSLLLVKYIRPPRDSWSFAATNAIPWDRSTDATLRSSNN